MEDRSFAFFRFVSYFQESRVSPRHPGYYKNIFHIPPVTSVMRCDRESKMIYRTGPYSRCTDGTRKVCISEPRKYFYHPSKRQAGARLRIRDR